jgi:hypothetical protein
MLEARMCWLFDSTGFVTCFIFVVICGLYERSSLPDTINFPRLNKEVYVGKWSISYCIRSNQPPVFPSTKRTLLSLPTSPRCAVAGATTVDWSGFRGLPHASFHLWVSLSITTRIPTTPASPHNPGFAAQLVQRPTSDLQPPAGWLF